MRAKRGCFASGCPCRPPVPGVELQILYVVVWNVPSYDRVLDIKRKRNEMGIMLAIRQMMTMCSTVCTVCYQSCYLFLYLSNGKGNDRIAVIFRCFSPRPR